MGIKRWVLAMALGIVLFSMGFMLLTSNKAALAVETLMKSGCEVLHLNPSYLTIDLAMAACGLIIMVLAFKGGFSEVYEAGGSSADSRDLVELVYEKRRLRRGLKLVVLGGGTGLSTLLRGIKHYTENISAIVSVSDDGGSSGRLSSELGILPPGDLRHCMTALADDENLISELFRYRFSDGKGLGGHSFGNLFLAALTAINGNDFQKALNQGSQLLSIKGRVIPATLTSTVLCAKMRDGRIVKGESKIPEVKGTITDVFLNPEHCTPPQEVLDAIAEADAIIMGPGSLYTSVIPPLLIDGIADAIKASDAPKIYVCNVMTQPGETDGYTASDHLKAVNKHTGGGKIADYMVVNAEPPHHLRSKYEKMGSIPIKPDLDVIREMGTIPVAANLVNEEASLARHDPLYLAETIMEVLDGHRFGSGEFRIASMERKASGE